jgi:hypothetical protein
MKMPSSMALTLLLTATGMLTSCAVDRRTAVPQVVEPIRFNDAEHLPYFQAGTALITGQGFLRQRAGGVVTCAGAKVALLPDTPFFRSILNAVLHGQAPDAAVLPNLAASGFPREGQCDAQGSFRFRNVPAGQWLVVTEVRWRVQGREQGGSLVRSVLVPSSGEVNAMLTDENRYGP